VIKRLLFVIIRTITRVFYISRNVPVICSIDFGTLVYLGFKKIWVKFECILNLNINYFGYFDPIIEVE